MIRVVFLLLICSSAMAIDLPDECRISNRGPMCAASSLETLARRHGVESLYGFRDVWYEKYAKGEAPKAWDWAIRGSLDKRHVNYLMTDQYSYDRRLLDKYANSHGVMVALKANTGWSVFCHAIIVTTIDDSGLEFYCSDRPKNASKHGTWRCSNKWFFGTDGKNGAWQGGSVVVLPEAEAAAE